MRFTKGDILVPRDAQFPEGAFVVAGYDHSGRLLAHALGGGFQFAISGESLDRFRLADDGERVRALFHRARFSLADSEQTFTGWTNGLNWNGWAMPHFEFEEAQRLMMWLKNDRARFDAELEAFVTISEDGEEEIWTAKTIVVTDGSSIKAYNIGAGAWIWDEIGN